MNKESTVAIVMGLVFGVLVAGGVVLYSAQNRQTPAPTTPQTTQASSSAVLSPTFVPPTVVVMSSLSIVSPSSGSATESKTAIVKGTAGVRSLVIVQSPIHTVSKKIEDDAFEIEIPLAYGENTISIFAYPENGSIPVQKSIYIYRVNTDL